MQPLIMEVIRLTNFKLLLSQLRHGSIDQQIAALKELRSWLHSLNHMIDEYEERLHAERRNHDGEKESTEP